MARQRKPSQDYSHSSSHHHRQRKPSQDYSHASSQHHQHNHPNGGGGQGKPHNKADLWRGAIEKDIGSGVVVQMVGMDSATHTVYARVDPKCPAAKESPAALEAVPLKKVIEVMVDEGWKFAAKEILERKRKIEDEKKQQNGNNNGNGKHDNHHHPQYQAHRERVLPDSHPSASTLLQIGAVWLLNETAYAKGDRAHARRLSEADAAQHPDWEDMTLRVHYVPDRFFVAHEFEWTKYTRGLLVGGTVESTVDSVKTKVPWDAMPDSKDGVIVYEDQDLGFAIINKPGGMPSHSTISNHAEDVVSMYGEALKKRQQGNGNGNERHPYVSLPIRVEPEMHGLVLVATKKEYCTRMNKLLNSGVCNDNAAVAKTEKKSPPKTVTVVKEEAVVKVAEETKEEVAEETKEEVAEEVAEKEESTATPSKEADEKKADSTVKEVAEKLESTAISSSEADEKKTDSPVEKEESKDESTATSSSEADEKKADDDNTPAKTDTPASASPATSTTTPAPKEKPPAPFFPITKSYRCLVGVKDPDDIDRIEKLVGRTIEHHVDVRSPAPKHFVRNKPKHSKHEWQRCLLRIRSAGSSTNKIRAACVSSKYSDSNDFTLAHRLWGPNVDHPAEQVGVTYVMQLDVDILSAGYRPHQIRGQLAALGCPIVGDRVYGGGTCEMHGHHHMWQRMALQCCALGFYQPKWVDAGDASDADGAATAAGGKVLSTSENWCSFRLNKAWWTDYLLDYERYV